MNWCLTWLTSSWHRALQLPRLLLPLHVHHAVTYSSARQAVSWLWLLLLLLLLPLLHVQQRVIFPAMQRTQLPRSAAAHQVGFAGYHWDRESLLLLPLLLLMLLLLWLLWRQLCRPVMMLELPLSQPLLLLLPLQPLT